MKQLKKIAALVIIGFLTFKPAHATKSQCAVLYFDVNGIDMTPEVAGSLIRFELEKIGNFEVIDRYDIKYIAQKNEIDLNGCYGKSCMLEIGEALKTDYVISGSLEVFSNFVILGIRLVDVKTKRIEKSIVNEYLNIPESIKIMMELSLKEMLGVDYDKDAKQKLSSQTAYANTISEPNVAQLDLAGPRMGMTFFTGDAANLLMAKRSNGGYDAAPVLSQFGYQFEKQYLNEGKWQALFEFIPVVTGIEQGIIIPSLTVMNGLRNNINGFEFAVGPSFSIGFRAKGYYDNNGNWNLEDENYSGNEYDYEYKDDSRGEPYLNTNLVLAVGKTLRSGRLNIPINVFVITGQNGWRYGVSFGFNAKKVR